MALYIEKYKPEYFIHVLFNNASHACLWFFFLIPSHSNSHNIKNTTWLLKP